MILSFALHALPRYVLDMQTADELASSPKRRPLQVYANEDLHAALTDLARREGEPVSVLLRRAIRRMIAESPETGTGPVKLILENRTNQHATLHFTWPDGTPGVCNILPGSEKAIVLKDRLGSAAVTALPGIVDQLGRFGLIHADHADRFDDAKHPSAPPWKGITYRVEGSLADV